MITQRWHRAIAAISLSLGGAIGLAESAIAQLRPIEDTDPGRSTGTTVEAFNAQIDLIRNGTRPANGPNLFHSFREFNIDQNRAAYFIVPDANVLNILARVTGVNPSQILGVLGTRQQLADGNFIPTSANLFLMNPNGIIFGAGAQLDVGGSFVATTANAIGFGNNAEFSTTSSVDAQNPLLRIDPSVFIFNQVTGRIENRSTAPAGVSNRGTFLGIPPLNVRGLRVPDGRSLIILGGDVVVDNSGLNAFGGRIEIGGVAGTGRVNVGTSGTSLQLGFPVETPRSNVSIINDSSIETISGGGGDIAIYANRFELTGDSNISSGIGFGLGAVGRRAGDIDIDATGNIFISGSSIENIIILGTGSSGTINMRGRTVEVSNSLIISTSFGVGDSGKVNIQARDNISLNRSFISTLVGSVSGATAGLSPENLATLIALGFPIFTGTGNGGDINLEANSISFADGTGIVTSTAFAEGRSGNVQIVARDSFSAQNGSTIITRTQGLGDAGNILIQAGNKVDFDGIGSNGARGGINSTVGQVPNFNFARSRNGGEIRIETGTLNITNGASINSSTAGQGNAGNVFVRARESISLKNLATILSSVEPSGVGNAGVIDIQANSLVLEQGSQILSILRSANQSTGLAGGRGRAGDIRIKVDNNFLITGAVERFPSQVVTSAEFGTEGDSGNIDIAANVLSLTEDGSINSATFGPGRAGNITLTVDQLIARAGGQISASSGRQNVSGAFGRGGDIQIDANQSIEIDEQNWNGLNRAGVFAETSSQSDAGNITANTQRLSVRNGGAISSGASGSGSLGGNGGDLNITATDFIELTGQEKGVRRPRASTLVTEASGLGNAGNITVQTPRLIIDERAAISSAVIEDAIGNGGEIRIFTDFLSIDNRGRIVSRSDGEGDAGNITIATHSLNLFNQSEISAASQGTKRAGNININARGAINARDGNISTVAQSSGGDVNITAQTIRLRGDSDIQTNVANGTGGNITLTADSIIALDDSDILAFAQQGRGGNITLNTRAFFGQNYRPGSPPPFDGNNRVDINASGTVSGIITLPDLSFIQNSLSQLSQSAIDTNQLLANSCIVRRNQPNSSTFYITGTGGLPERPGYPSSPAFPTGEVRTIEGGRGVGEDRGDGGGRGDGEDRTTSSTSPSSSPRPWKIGDRVQEPDAVYQLPNGELVLSHECR